MSEKIKLVVDNREATGKKVAKLRSEGLVPGVIYGSEFEPTNVQFIQQDAQRIVNKAGYHTPIELDISGKKKTALIKSVEYAPAKRDVTHISFQAVRANEVVTTEIPLHIINEDESAAKKAGLIILPTIEKINVKAKISDLPEKIELDAAQLAEAGDRLTLADAKLPKGVEIIDLDPETVVAAVHDPAVLEAKNAAADAEADAERASGEDETAAENVPSEQEEESAE